MTEQSHIPSLTQMKSTQRLPRRQGRTSAAGAVAAAAPQPAEAPNTDRRTDRASEPSATPERRPTGRRATRPSRAQSNVDDAKQQITLFLPNEVIAEVNAHCERGQDGKPLTHGAAVINAMIAVDDQLAELVAEDPTPTRGGWAVEQPMRRESGQNSMWTCSLMVRNRRQLDERAEALGVTRSRLVAAALRAYLASDSTPATDSAAGQR